MKPAWTKVLWPLVWLLPVAWTGSLIYRYGVDVPHFDQWNGLAPLFVKADAGTLQFADFFAQHNEHRIVVPRLIMFALARVTHWNVRAELLAIWLLGCLCAVNLFRAAAMTGFKPFDRPWSMLAVTAIVFSPIGWENWLWGFQIGFLLPVACITAIIWIAPSIRYPLNFVLTMALCAICTFSIANGFTYWLIVFPLLLFSNGRIRWKGRKTWLLAYASCFILTTAAYFAGYQKPAHLPSPLLILKHPIQGVQCVFAILGAPFAHGTALDTFAVAEIVGAVQFFLLLLVLFVIWRQRRDRALVARSLPWLTLAAFACANAITISIGRVGIGIVNSGMTSRYMPYSTALILGLLFLVPMALEQRTTGSNPSPRHERLRTCVIGLATLLAFLHVTSAIAITRQWREIMHARLIEKSFVLSANAVDDPGALAAYVHPDTAPLKPLIGLLDRLGYLRPASLRTNSISEIASPEPSDPARYGGIEHSGKPAQGKFVIAGWGIVPEKRRAADAVLLTCDDPNGEAHIFAIAVANLPRPDLVTSDQLEVYRNCGWMKEIDLSLIANGSGRVRAWAFDAEERRAYPMNGFADVSP